MPFYAVCTFMHLINQPLPTESVAAASAVVLIAAAAVSLIEAVITCENKDKNDEKNPVAVASVTKKHSVDLLSHLPLHHMLMCFRCD